MTLELRKEYFEKLSKQIKNKTEDYKEYQSILDNIYSLKLRKDYFEKLQRQSEGDRADYIDELNQIKRDIFNTDNKINTQNHSKEYKFYVYMKLPDDLQKLKNVINLIKDERISLTRASKSNDPYDSLIFINQSTGYSLYQINQIKNHPEYKTIDSEKT